MLPEKYSYAANEDGMMFTFESTGPKGVIKKVIKYMKIAAWEDFSVYNLAFGDWSDELNDIDDSTNSNNNDRDKVLATVASTVLEFTARHGQLAVVAEGATPARTRLYQMAINAHLAEIEDYFLIYGMYLEILYPFEPGINYQAFCVVKK